MAEQLAPECSGWKLVKGEVAADDRECFRVFRQAFLVETLGREAAPGKVSLRRVDLAEPAFVSPGTRAEEQLVCGGKIAQGDSELDFQLGRWVVE